MDASVGAYQLLGSTILKLTAVPTLLCMASFAFVTGYILPMLGTTGNSSSISTQLGEVVVAIALAIGVGGPLFFIGASYSAVLITSLISDYMIGNVPNPQVAARSARRLLPRISLLSLRATLVSGTGFLISVGMLMLSAYLSATQAESPELSGAVGLLAVMGLWVGVVLFPIILTRYALAVPIMVLERVGSGQAVKRSVALSKSSPFFPSAFSNILGLEFLIFCLWIFIWQGVSTISSGFGLKDWLKNATSGTPLYDLSTVAMDLLPWFLVLWVVIPVWCVTTTILYYERRTRLEGYDIEALAQDVWRADKQSRFEL